MRICVELLEAMHLEVAEVPQGLPNLVTLLLRTLFTIILIKMEPIDPIHGQDPLRTHLVMIARKAYILEMARLLDKFLTTLQLQCVICLLCQSLLNLVQIRIDRLRLQIHETHRKGAHNLEIRVQTVRHARILHLDRILSPLFLRLVHLPDGCPCYCGLGKVIEDFLRPFA